MSKDGRQAAFRRGLEAEAHAIAHFAMQGFTCLASRVRTKAGEIDLIFARSGLIVFAEVKARRSFDEAAYALSPRQMSRIARAASAWLAENPQGGEPSMRFDVVLVSPSGAMQHLENAFDLGETLWG